MNKRTKPSIVNHTRARTANAPTPNLEQYVETIAYLLTKDKVCTVSEIAETASVTRPAASRAVKDLADRDLVTHKAYGYVDLTDDGQRLAEKLAARHATLQRFLHRVLQYDEATADVEACRLEHHIDDELTRRLERLVEVVEGNQEMIERLGV